MFPTVVVINVANAIGNLADDLNVRLSLRANGGVGSLVRLLRDDVDPAVQVRGEGGDDVDPAVQVRQEMEQRWCPGIPL